MNNQPKPFNMGAMLKQLETAPFEVCGAEPEQQAYKQKRMGWLCDSCYGKLPEPRSGIKPIPNTENIKCAKCDKRGKNYCGIPGTCTSKDFIKIFQYKKVSALVSQTGREQTIELQITKCAVCGAQKVIKK